MPSTPRRSMVYSVRASAVGAALFTLLFCAAETVRAQSVFLDGFEPTVDGCVDPLISPAGWNVFPTSWVDAWSSPDGSPVATFPNSVGFPVPIGAGRNSMRVIGFIMPAEMSITITWDQVQSNPREGYTANPALSMYIAISPCGADARPLDYTGSDPFRSSACRKVAGASSMFLSTTPGSGTYVCRLEADRRYFMTLGPFNPFDGLTQGEHTCSAPESQTDCDVQARHSGQ